LADLQRTVYPHSGHPLAEGRAQDRVSSPAKDRRSVNCATNQVRCWNAARHTRRTDDVTTEKESASMACWCLCRVPRGGSSRLL